MSNIEIQDANRSERWHQLLGQEIAQELIDQAYEDIKLGLHIVQQPRSGNRTNHSKKKIVNIKV